MLARSIAVGFLLTGCTPNVVIESNDDDKGTVVSMEGDEPGECNDGADNDGDGYFDCDDNDCWNSPDCTGSGGTTNNGGGGGGGGNTTTTTSTDDCEPFCGIESVELTFRMVMDWDTEAPSLGLVDCGSEFAGSGEYHGVDGNFLTFAGSWGAVDDGCLDATGLEFIRDWSGGAFHTFYFTSSGDVVLDWYAHRDEDEAGTDGDPVFFWTEMDLEVDVTKDEFELYILQEEPLKDPSFPLLSLGTLYQEFRATFRR